MWAEGTVRSMCEDPELLAHKGSVREAQGRLEGPVPTEMRGQSPVCKKAPSLEELLGISVCSLQGSPVPRTSSGIQATGGDGGAGGLYGGGGGGGGYVGSGTGGQGGKGADGLIMRSFWLRNVFTCIGR